MLTRLRELIGADVRHGDFEPIGVIDIGSNSVRLVVYEGAVRAPTPLFNEKILCGLGRDVASTGSLRPEAAGRALLALTRFKTIARVLGVKSIKAIATAAVREAKSGEDFIRKAEKAAGCEIEILSGEQEAKLAAQGIMMGFIDPDGVAGDLGGGSLELIEIDGAKLKNGATLPLGGLRLIDTTGGNIDEAMKAASNLLNGISWIKEGKGRNFYAVGGAWRSLAKLHMEHTKYPLRVMQGYRIDAREALEFSAEVRSTKKLQSLPGISEVARARREVLPYGAVVLESLLRAMKPQSVVFSVYGIREGYIYSLLNAYERKKDPLISFCEDYASIRSRSIEHAKELCRWTDQIFSGKNDDETYEERRLRHAACLLSDVGWRAHPDYRGDQSLNTIAHAGLGGVDHEGRVFLALAVFYRHETAEQGDDELSERLMSLVNKRVVKRAKIVGSAVRTAHMLSIGMPGVIDETSLVYDGGRLVLTIPKAYAGLEGERLQRRFNGLAGHLGKVGEIRIGK